MRVRELIEELQKCDQEAPVHLKVKGSLYDRYNKEHNVSLTVTLNKLRWNLKGPVLEGEQ